jgi:hypothetical protein
MYCILGLVLILVAVYLQSNRKMDQLFYALAILVILLIGSMLTNKPTEGFLGFAPTEYSMGSCGGRMLKAEDSIVRNPAVSWEGVTYKNTSEEPDRKHQWRRPPSNLPLVKDTYITSPIGEDILLGDDLVSPYYPSVDGKPESQHRMFMFAQNQCRPDCCPATYSCDGGCVCTTEAQRDMIAGRGGNASKGNDI